MILGASRWLELNAPSAASRPAAIAAVRARIRTADLRIAHSSVEDRGSIRPCVPGRLADLKLHATGSQKRCGIIRSVDVRSPVLSMARPAPLETVGAVVRTPSRLDSAPLARVYGAALAAAGSPGMAADVTGHVLAGAPESGERELVARAVRLAVRGAPHPAFAALEPDDREAVALVRLAGCSDGEAASVLGIDVAEVRRRLLRGLRALA